MVLAILLTLLLPTQVSQPAPAVDGGPDTADLSGRIVVLSIDDGYHCVYENVYPLLRQYNMPATLALVAGCVGTGRASYRASDRFMNASEIRELIDSCDIEIASHTIDHAWVTRLDSASAWRETVGSKQILESLFGVKVITFVYPYGDMDMRARRMVRRAGYAMARAVRAGTVNLWADPYRIPEVELRIETRLDQVERHIRRHQITVLLLHRIVTEPRVFTEWPVDDFAALIGWLDRHNVRVTTLAGLYRGWWRENLEKALLEQIAAGRGRSDRLFEDVDVDATRTAHPR